MGTPVRSLTSVGLAHEACILSPSKGVTLSSHTQTRKFILTLILLIVVATATLIASDSHSASPESTTPAPLVSDSHIQTPGSSLEGINEPISEILWYKAVEDAEATRLAAEATARRTAIQASSTTSTTPQVAATRQGDDPRCPAPITALIHKYFDRFGVETASNMTHIAWRESNCRADVASSSGCFSVLQMALPLHKGLYAAAGYPDWYANRYNAEANIAAAALLYAGSGMSPWKL